MKAKMEAGFADFNFAFMRINFTKFKLITPALRFGVCHFISFGDVWWITHDYLF